MQVSLQSQQQGVRGCGGLQSRPRTLRRPPGETQESPASDTRSSPTLASLGKNHPPSGGAQSGGTLGAERNEGLQLSPTIHGVSQ